MKNNSKKINTVSTTYDEWRLFDSVWAYEDYAVLLENLLEDRRIILGGDILTRDCDGVLESSDCGWYYDGDDALDSNVCAQKYLAGLSSLAEKEKLYISIVLKKGVI